MREKGLWLPGDGHLALRVPASGQFFSWSANDQGELVARRSEDGSIESMVGARRPGIGGMVIARPCWGSSLAEIDQPMPAIFDEQVRQIGPGIQRLSWREGEFLSSEDERRIDRGDTAYLWGSKVLVLGYTLDRAVFNMELLEKCAKSFVLAYLTGLRVSTLPWWVRLIAFRRLRRDEAKAAGAFKAGQMPTGLGSY